MLAGLALVVAYGLVRGISPLLGTEPPWRVERPTNTRRTGAFRHPLLKESSGVAVSRRYPGTLWTLNDSGNDPLLFATDTLGRNLGVLAVPGTSNRDWEAIALGPCETRDCLYIADTGNNRRNFDTSTIYRLEEPGLPLDVSSRPRVETLEFRFPKGTPDVEAAFVDGTGAIYLISKSRGSLPAVYRLAPESWTDDEHATAELVDRLPIDTSSLGSRVTDAALSPSGRTVAVRTYLAIYLFGHTPAGRLEPLGVACSAAGLQLQGEGISWLDDRVLVLTSEGGFGSPGTIVLLECGDRRLGN